MLKTACLTIAIGLISALFALPASAAPIARVAPSTAATHLTLVRDGCPHGFYFSKHRGACVAEEPVVRRDPCPRGFHFSDHRGKCIENERVIRVECPRGTHFSERRQACVENVVIQCPRGTHFSERRQGCVDNPSPAAAAVGAVLHAIVKNKNHDDDHDHHGQH